MHLSEHDEARQADVQTLAQVIAQHIAGVRSAPGRASPELGPEEFIVAETLIWLEGVIWAGEDQPVFDQVKRVLGL